MAAVSFYGPSNHTCQRNWHSRQLGWALQIGFASVVYNYATETDYIAFSELTRKYQLTLLSAEITVAFAGAKANITANNRTTAKSDFYLPQSNLFCLKQQK